MKKFISSAIIGFLSLGIIIMPYTTVVTPQAQAAVTDWQRGGSIYPTWSGDFDTDSFRQSLRNLKATGANYVALIVPEYQANTSSSDIYAGGDTPTDASLISAINYAHSLGLHVTLKPHLGPQSGEWRALINANDRDAWFRNYSAMLNHLGDIGNQTGVEGMTIGTELISMATYTSNNDNTQRWETMISSLRSHFHGFLTYSANWGGNDFAEEAPHIGFWGSLDYIGLSAYYPLAQGQGNPSIDALTGSWDFWNNTKISELHNQYGKQVLFTEIGYRSADDAHSHPWDPFAGGGFNGQEQANDYQALFQYWNNQPWMSGVYLWNWNSDPNSGDNGNTDYTPQNKNAQQTMTQWWANGNNNPPTNGGGTSTPPNNGGTQNSGTWSATASPSSNPEQGNPVTVSVKVTNSGSVNDAIADVEIYDSSNSRVDQQFFEHQTISSSQPGNYQVSWTPTSQGTYTVKVGTFNNNWTTNYFWGDSVTTINVGTQSSGGTGTSTPPASGPVDTNIWWPTDGSTVSGVQPFKAMLTNKSVSDYTMFWQVDGGQLNQMNDNSTDYPHKEADVDLSSWNWKGNGPYNINFVSKDSSGNTLSQKSVNINISH